MIHADNSYHAIDDVNLLRNSIRYLLRNSQKWIAKILKRETETEKLD